MNSFNPPNGSFTNEQTEVGFSSGLNFEIKSAFLNYKKLICEKKCIRNKI